MIDAGDRGLLERSLGHAVSNYTGPKLDERLADLGWLDALSSDPRSAIGLLFELQGAANASSSAVDRVFAHIIGPTDSPILLPRIACWQPPASLVDDILRVDGIGMMDWRRPRSALAIARDGNSYSAFEIDLEKLQPCPVGGMDPSLHLTEVKGTIPSPSRRIGLVDWPKAVGLGQLALAHELVGAASRMLELARQHALDRFQFGQPIARFQAVRHRLADSLVAIEAAKASLDAAWLDGRLQAASMAKATAGRSARIVARHSQQVLAGIGFTTEHPFHLYLKRVLVLELLLGSTRDLTRQLGAEIIERGQPPAPCPL